MKRSLPARAAFAALVPLLFALACSDSPTATPAADEAQMVMTVSVVGTPIATLVVTITAPDIPVPIVTNLTVVEGSASGTLKMPPGYSRLITVLAYDDEGEITHEGGATVDVFRGNNNPPLSIGLIARSGYVDVVVHIASLSILFTTPAATVEAQQTLLLTTSIVTANGTPVSGILDWATTDPAFATVDQSGLVTGVRAGTATIVASFAGVAAVREITITPSGINTLNVVLTGSGSGSVTSQPDGIACGSDCSHAYQTGTVVQLIPIAAPGSVFLDWSGGGCSGDGQCFVDVTHNTTVSAYFAAYLYPIHITVVGPGTVSDVGTYSGLTCTNGVCSGYALWEDVVTIYANPQPGAVFSQWTGDACAGSASPSCEVTLTGVVNLTATFANSKAVKSDGR